MPARSLVGCVCSSCLPVADRFVAQLTRLRRRHCRRRLRRRHRRRHRRRCLRRCQRCFQRVVSELTGAPAASPTAETPLMEAGGDSLAATELSSRLRSLTGVALSPTIVFELPTPRAVAVHRCG